MFFVKSFLFIIAKVVVIKLVIIGYFGNFFLWQQRNTQKLIAHICTTFTHPRVTLKQWSQTQFLNGHSSAELQITPAQKFLVILKTLISWFRCVWFRLELTVQPSGNWVWDQCSKTVFLNPGPGRPPTLHILCVPLIKHTWFNSLAHYNKL